MDRLDNGDYAQRQDIQGVRALESGGGAQNSRTQQPRQLQKKRSNASRTAYAQRQTAPPQTSYGSDPRGFTGMGDGAKARKGSLRDAVRRIFGRRSKEVEAQPAPASSSGYGYARGNTLGPTPQEASPRGQTPPEDLVQRTLSAPIPMLPQQNFSRIRSPYAMQFPHSASLKPLDLGNPFTAPGSQLRRRQSMPSVLLNDADAAAVAQSISATNDAPKRGLGHVRDTSFDSAASKIRREKRRSRSADDLRRSQQQAKVSPRRRKEDMRQWRESFQGSVLRASGFTVPRPDIAPSEERDEDKTPVAGMEDPFNDTKPMIATPALQRDTSIRDLGSASGYGTEISRDIEDRVARLEAGLQSFRGQLAQLSTDRNRRTILVGDAPSRRPASSSDRTASMLATDLQTDLGPSNYQYQYTNTARPSTSPQPPRTPTRTDPATMTPYFSLSDQASEDPFVSPARNQPATTGGGSQGNLTMPPQYTFRSLYEMLADERSARRRLETQMKTLHNEIANLHLQVSQSNLQSQRSSYYAPMDPMVGSSRLHAILRDTDATPPSTSQSREQFDATQFSSGQGGLVSRFSGSESETGGGAEAEGEELQTPHDAYQTPLEGQGMFPWAGNRGSEGEMF